MRFLVTGAGGFLGGHLVRGLAAAGHEVVGTVLERAPEARGGIAFEPLDILDAEAVRRLIERLRPASVVHLANFSHVGESWTRMTESFVVNVLGTEAVLAAARGVGARFLFASSAEVYGAVEENEQPLVESRRPAPRTPYALTKAAAERLVLGAGGVVVRLFNLVGPGQGANFALPAFAEQLAAMAIDPGRERQLAVGNLTARRDFVHVEDGADGVALLAERGRPGEIYNLASGAAHSMAEMLARLLAVAGMEVEIREDAARLRPVDVPLLKGDSSRLRALGWAPRRSIDEALAGLWQAVLRGAGGA